VAVAVALPLLPAVPVVAVVLVPGEVPGVAAVEVAVAGAQERRQPVRSSGSSARLGHLPHRWGKPSSAGVAVQRPC